jgi:hypothetical protein
VASRAACRGGLRLRPQPRDGCVGLVELRLLLEQLRPLGCASTSQLGTLWTCGFLALGFLSVRVRGKNRVRNKASGYRVWRRFSQLGTLSGVVGFRVRFEVS